MLWLCVNKDDFDLRSFLIAMIDRAYLDMTSASTPAHFRREATLWILAKFDAPREDYRFTFQQCVEGLDIPDDRVQYLILVAKEIYYGN